jgi:hypothetical protein
MTKIKTNQDTKLATPLKDKENTRRKERQKVIPMKLLTFNDKNFTESKN